MKHINMISFFKKDKKEPESLKDILGCLNRLENDIREMKENLEAFKKEGRSFLSKTGVVRYNPFREIGGDQSFSIAFLDKDNNGVVVTSLFSKEGNRVYAKPLKNGKSKYSLSKEEEKAIETAVNNGDK
ncbi:MAG: DUF4446 family protein [Candidatus Nealsonbacteria bacterium]|nr:DUF4446 family protein [Candidatus Nealsonbacteria bacterium]